MKETVKCNSVVAIVGDACLVYHKLFLDWAWV